MSFFLPSPLLAADPGSFIGIIILVIGFISWIMNLINSQQQPPVKPQRRRPAGPSQKRGRLDEEIEQFLRERQPEQDRADGERGPRGRQGRRPERPFSVEAEPAAEIEIVDEQELRQRLARDAEKASELTGRRSRPAGIPLGSGIQTHLDEYLPEHRLEHHGREDVPEAAGVAEVDHFHEYATGAGSAAGNATGERIRNVLSDPRRVKEAIIINEVLTRRPIRGRRVP